MSKKMRGFLAGRPAVLRLDMVWDASGWKWRNLVNGVCEVVRPTSTYMLVVQLLHTKGVGWTVQEHLTLGIWKRGSDSQASCSSNLSLENRYLIF